MTVHMQMEEFCILSFTIVDEDKTIAARSIFACTVPRRSADSDDV